jgi:dCTP deaminase
VADLSDRDILTEIHLGNILCEPFNRANLSAASIDLRLGSKIYRRKRPLLNRLFPRLFPLPPVKFDVDENGRVTVIRNPDDFELIDLLAPGNTPDKERYILYPGDFVLVPTLEYVGSASPNILSQISDKSTIARLAVGSFFGAGFGDPGNALNFTLELKNNGHEPIELQYGQHICQIRFAYLSSPVMQSYDGKYLNSRTVEGAK